MTKQAAERLEKIREWWSDYPEDAEFDEPFLLRLIKELQAAEAEEGQRYPTQGKRQMTDAFDTEILKANKVPPEGIEEARRNFEYFESKKDSLKGPWAAVVNGSTIVEASSVDELTEKLKQMPGQGQYAYADQIAPKPSQPTT